MLNVIIIFSIIIKCQTLWIPFSSSNNMNLKRGINKPCSMKINNQNLVLWKSVNGTYNCLNDVCPHRYAQLSRGIITKAGNIKCGYHGIEFDTNGDCLLLPQSQNNKCSSISVDSIEVIEHYGLLWLKYNDCNVKIPHIMNFEDINYQSTWYQQDIRLPIEFILENTVDILHVESTHHGIMGLNRENILTMYESDYIGYNLDYFDATGFKISYDRAKNVPKLSIVFSAPYHTSITFHLKGGDLSIVAFVVPVDALTNRLISTLTYKSNGIHNKFKERFMNRIIKMITRKSLSKKIIDQDIYQIVGQSINSDSTTKYPMYTPGDYPNIVFRKWLKTYKPSVD